MGRLFASFLPPLMTATAGVCVCESVNVLCVKYTTEKEEEEKEEEVGEEKSSRY